MKVAPEDEISQADEAAEKQSEEWNGGLRGPKESRYCPSERDLEIYRAHRIQQQSVRNVAAEFELSPTRISQLCQQVENWASVNTRYDATKMVPEQRLNLAEFIQRERLEFLYAQAVEGWRQSSTPRASYKSVNTPAGVREERTVVQQSGRVQCLAQAQRLVDRIAALDGAGVKTPQPPALHVGRLPEKTIMNETPANQRIWILNRIRQLIAQFELQPGELGIRVERPQAERPEQKAPEVELPIAAEVEKPMPPPAEACAREAELTPEPVQVASVPADATDAAANSYDSAAEPKSAPSSSAAPRVNPEQRRHVAICALPEAPQPPPPRPWLIHTSRGLEWPK